MAITSSRITWNGPGGCREVFRIALPLILSTSAFTIQLFVDRVFLTWHSTETMAAAMYAGIVSFTLFSLFMGTSAYVNTFVAQYYGAGATKRISESIWQGLYFSIGAGLLMAAIAPMAGTIIDWAGHDPAMREHETIYLKIMWFGAMPGLVGGTLSYFYTGRGKTWTVMRVNVAATMVNLVLDYCLIFGNFGFPKMGITGAAVATVCSGTFSCIVFFILFAQKKYRHKYATLSSWRFDRELFGRLIRFGLPSGIQFMGDIVGFTLFITFIGRIDSLAFTATSMAFQINNISFLPMIGFSIATSTLVGQALGKDKPELAQKSTWSAACMTMSYMICIASVYWFFPEIFMYPFGMHAEASEFAIITPVVKNLLCFTAIYSLFNTGNLIFSAALKGAGDTRFVMIVSISLNWLVMVIPSYFAIRLATGFMRLYLAWVAISIYVCLLAVVFLLRFLGGKWKSMRVIEATAPTLPRRIPPTPTVETDIS